MVLPTGGPPLPQSNDDGGGIQPNLAAEPGALPTDGAAPEDGNFTDDDLDAYVLVHPDSLPAQQQGKQQLHQKHDGSARLTSSEAEHGPQAARVALSRAVISSLLQRHPSSEVRREVYQQGLLPMANKATALLTRIARCGGPEKYCCWCWY